MRIFFIIFLMTVFIDQTTKLLIKSYLKLHQSIEIIKDIFNITYVENPGISFGILAGGYSEVKRWILLFIILIAIILVFLYWYKYRTDNFLYNISCGLIFGGAIGNFLDRLFIGKVVDFIEVGYKNFKWPVFNMADTSITIGTILLIIYFLFGKKYSMEKKDASNTV